MSQALCPYSLSILVVHPGQSAWTNFVHLPTYLDELTSAVSPDAALPK
jgi:hypothetical protein